jgi:hypothetical protein
MNHFENCDQYLEAITTSIDLESDKDLHLYSYDVAFSNQHMSTIGIKILNQDLIAKYGNKKYIIRCYKDQTKIFECLLGIDYFYVTEI